MDSQSINKISTSLGSTLMGSDLTPVTIDLAEVSFDQLLSDGVFKDIPIFSTLIGLGKTAHSIREQLFLKKIIYFISKINTIPQKEREDIINEIDQSRKFRVRVGEKLLYIIDKSEDHKSAEIIAILFSAFLKREISYEDFLKSSMIVNNIFINDLIWFVQDDSKEEYQADDIKEFLNTALFNFEVEPVEVEVKDEDDWERGIDGHKYKTEINGGELRVNISLIGEVIRKTLKDKIG